MVFCMNVDEENCMFIMCSVWLFVGAKGNRCCNWCIKENRCCTADTWVRVYNYARKRQQSLSIYWSNTCSFVLVQLKENCINVHSLLACKTEHFRLCVCAVFAFSRIDGVRLIVPNGHFDLCTLLFWMTFIGTVCFKQYTCEVYLLFNMFYTKYLSMTICQINTLCI